jgi:hypothetical protein
VLEYGLERDEMSECCQMRCGARVMASPLLAFIYIVLSEAFMEKDV